MKKIYLVENLGCAHCASKMEERINALPEVQDCTLTYTTKQLAVTAENPAALLPTIRNICQAIESQVDVVERKRAIKHNASAQNHHHDHDEHEHCDCHEHEHEHSHMCECGNPCCQGDTCQAESSSDHSDLIKLAVGGGLFILLVILEHTVMKNVSSLWMALAFAVPFLILGGEVLLSAAKGIGKGQIFDENFLMAIATIGAYAIGDFSEAAGVMLFFSIGEAFEHIAVEKSRKAIMDAVDMRPETVNRLVDGVVTVIPAEEAHIGDIIEVRAGERIPLDGKIIQGESRIDTSPVTGEPVPVSVSIGSAVTSGCLNTSGVLQIEVVNELSDSMVTKILDAVENAAAGKPKMDRFITRFSKVYTPFVVIAALLTAIIPSIVTGNWSQWIYTALTFLVISCPCALVLSVPLAFFTGIGSGSKQGILFKGGSSLEAISKVKAVVMDKTGTLTQGNFKVQSISTSHGYTENEVLALAGGLEASSTHPIATSILSYAKEQSVTLAQVSQITEIAGHGIQANWNGKQVLVGKKELLTKNGIAVKLDDAPYGTIVYVAVGNEMAGSLVLADTLKATSRSAIAKLKKAGIHTVMLTGDNENAANYVASELGIDETFAGLLPDEKLDRMSQIRNSHGGVMFVGDGINDAPVLAGADVGAAMGSGADAAIDAADVVFMTSDMEAVSTSFAIAKRTNLTAKANIIFALAIKAAVMVLGILGLANMWFAVFADSGVAMICVVNAILGAKGKKT